MLFSLRDIHWVPRRFRIESGHHADLFRSKNLIGKIKIEGVKMVARDGIEPPTPAFSGLRSTN
jgi:hypothetical protein